MHALFSNTDFDLDLISDHVSECVKFLVLCQ